MISALVLAAGLSRRMGSPKMALPWGEDTVLGRVVRAFRNAGIEDVLVVSGGARQKVEEIAVAQGARVVFNPGFASGEMLSSLQAGLVAMSPGTQAAMVALGDQPQIQEATVRSIVVEYQRSSAALIVPSYQMHRGHPWLVARPMWAAIHAMHSPETPRSFLNQHAAEIVYIESDSATVLQDLDTPEDYLKSHQ